MEPLTTRQADILALARTLGKVTVDGLAERFAVTPQTIRKDLNDLCARHMMERVHGGAVVSSTVENLGYDARRVLASAEKRRIARRAAAIIPNDCSLFINIGTTTEEVAQALTNHTNLLVITNNINVANTLRRSPRIEVIIAGGLVRRADGGIVGEATVDFIRQFKVDYAVVGVSAIDEDGSLLDYDYREVRVAQAIIDNARHTLLVADALKFARTAPIRIGHIGQMHSFVTDTPPPERLLAICRDAGVAVEVAALTD